MCKTQGFGVQGLPWGIPFDRERRVPLSARHAPVTAATVHRIRHYRMPAGQKYVVGDLVRGEYYYSVTFTTDSHRVVTGKDLYYQIQFGHRVAFVRAADVRLEPSVL